VSASRAARSKRPLWIGAGASAASAAAAALLWWLDRLGGVFAVGAAIVVAVGLFVPHRATLGFGVSMFAVASIVGTAGEPTGNAIAVNGLFAVVCVGLLVAGDLSYSARRSARMNQSTVEGFVLAHLAAVVGGILLCALTLAAVLAVDWPRWSILVPAIALPVGALAMVLLVNRYQRSLNLSPQAAAPTGPPMGAPVRTAAGPIPPPPSGRRSRSPMPPPPPPRPQDRVR